MTLQYLSKYFVRKKNRVSHIKSSVVVNMGLISVSVIKSEKVIEHGRIHQ